MKEVWGVDHCTPLYNPSSITYDKDTVRVKIREIYLLMIAMCGVSYQIY